MQFIKSERIILSQNESDIWIKFDNILSGLARGTENPYTKERIVETQNSLADLWNELDIELEGS